MKSELRYSIDTLKNEGVTLWFNKKLLGSKFMRKMNKGDKVFFYHSNCKPWYCGTYGGTDLNIVDPTQFDKDSKY